MNKHHSHSDLLAQAIARVRAKHGLRAADEIELQCPQCNYIGPEDSFNEVDNDQDQDDDADGFRTDPITTSFAGVSGQPRLTISVTAGARSRSRDATGRVTLY